MGVSEKSIVLPNRTHGAHDLVVVAGDEPEALVVGIEEREVATLGVDGDLVGYAGVVEVVAPAHRCARAESKKNHEVLLAHRRVGELRESR